MQRRARPVQHASIFSKNGDARKSPYGLAPLLRKVRPKSNYKETAPANRLSARRGRATTSSEVGVIESLPSRSQRPPALRFPNYQIPQLLDLSQSSVLTVSNVMFSPC